MRSRSHLGGLGLAVFASFVGVSACTEHVHFVGLEDEPIAPDPAPPDATDPLPGFSWVVPNALAGLPNPDRNGQLYDNLAYIVDQGARTLVTLTIDPLDETTVRAHGLAWLHYPVVDFQAPTLEQLLAFLDEVDSAHARGWPVAVHCTYGKGRTGTFLAAYFVAQGMTGDEAIEHVRQLRPGSIETAVQEAIVGELEAVLADDD